MKKIGSDICSFMLVRLCHVRLFFKRKNILSLNTLLLFLNVVHSVKEGASYWDGIESLTKSLMRSSLIEIITYALPETLKLFFIKDVEPTSCATSFNTSFGLLKDVFHHALVLIRQRYVKSLFKNKQGNEKGL
jgi:hypothetical protein